MKNELTNTTIWQPCALSRADITAIAREHATLVATLIDAPRTNDLSEHKLAVIGGQMLLTNPSLYDSIVSVGCNLKRADAAALSLLSKAALALEIIHLTSAKFAGQPLWDIVRAEIQPASSQLGGSCH